MRIDADRLPSKRIAQNDIGRLAPDSGQRDEIVEIVGDVAAEACHQFSSAVVDRLGFIAIKINLADLKFEFCPRRGRVVAGGAVASEKFRRDFIDQIVARLGGENKRDQELQRVLEVEIELGVGVNLLEPLDDPAYS